MAQVEKCVNLFKEQSRQGLYGQLTEFIIDNQDNVFHNAAFLDEVLQQLDIQEHSAAILCLMFNKIQIPGVNWDQMFAHTLEFITECNEEQVKALPNLFAGLCRAITDKLVESKQYLKGIELLHRAIAKLQSSPSQLTSIHCELAKLCLLAKCLKPALTYLDVDITDIHKESETFDVKYYLMYFYYGGIIYCTLRNFERAFYFFQSAVNTSGTAISEIVVESYKKYILVSLLVYGKVLSLTAKSSQSWIGRAVRPFTAPYHELSSAYSADSVTDLQKVLAKHTEVYTNDTNLGLVKQVIASVVKVKIQKLTKTFMTLSLADMATKVGLANAQEAERIILQMIEDEEIFASINQRDGMVVFLDNPEKYNTPQMYRRIELELNKCITLNDKLKHLDQDIALSQKYQKIRSVLE